MMNALFGGGGGMNPNRRPMPRPMNPGQMNPRIQMPSLGGAMPPQGMPPGLQGGLPPQAMGRPQMMQDNPRRKMLMNALGGI